MDVAARLDARHGTGSAFQSVLEHAVKASRCGGLNGTGLFFMLDATQNTLVTQPFVVGVQDTPLSDFVAFLKRVNSYDGHGTVVGAYVDGQDVVLMQFIQPNNRHVTFKCHVPGGNIEVDDSIGL